MHPGDFVALAYMVPAATLLLAALIGWGRLVRRFLPSETAPSWIGDAWTGWAAGTLFLQIWHLQFPVDWRTAAIMCAIGLAGLRRDRNPDRPHPKRLTPENLVVAGLCLVVFAFMVRQIRSDLQVYDAGMYYYQAIRWVNEHPVIPGLGNLNQQLGINLSYFLWAALLNLHPLWRNGFMVVNALFVVLAMAPGIGVLTRMGRHAPTTTPADILNVLLLPVLALFALNCCAANPTPDFFTWIAGAAVFARSVEWLCDPRPDPRPPWHLMLLCVALVTVKLSMLVYSASIIILLASVFVVRSRAAGSRSILVRHLAVAVGIAVAGGLPWLAKNIVTTGYPLFPSTAVSLPVEWKIPETKTRFIGSFITAMARHPVNKALRAQINDALFHILNSSPHAPDVEALVGSIHSTPWLSPWIVRTFSKPLNVTWLIATVLLMLPGGTGLRRTSEAHPSRILPLLYLPLGASMVFWISTAPDIRFCYPLPHLLLLLAGTRTALRLPIDPALLRRAAGILAVILVAIVSTEAFPRRSKLWKTTAIRPRILVDTRPFVTQSGLVINVPVHDVRCFDTDLPSTFIRNPHLALRSPSRGLRGGFKDDSPLPE